MAFMFSSGWIDFLVILLSTVISIVIYFKWAFTYWEKRKIPYLKPSIPWGTLANPFVNRKSFGELLMDQYNEAKQNGLRFVGLYGFTSPICMIIDPLLVKHILSTDFKYFANRGMYFNEKDDPLSAHLFSLEGIKWRNLRTKLTPTFTSGRLKTMFKILIECGDQLKEAMHQNCIIKEPVDIKDILGRFTINIIGSAAFGLECNSFVDAESKFKKYGETVFRASKFQSFKGMLAFMNPHLARRIGICITPSDTSDFFMKVTKDTVEYREKNKIVRNDFMQLLINLKNGIKIHDDDESEEYNHDGKSLTFEELAAQAFVFFVAGFETSSTTMTFVLFEMANNPDMQDKLRQEIQQVLQLFGGKITYEAINEMKYLGQVIEEALRKYSPLPMLNRKCNEDYTIPNTDKVIEQGTPIFIPLVGLHSDPDYFPNPEKFDPERFSKENRNSIVPYTYLPFGEGPRICIGLRFGVLQTKVGLIVLLKNFKVSLNEKTRVPLKMDPSSFVQSTLGDMWLNVEKI